MIWIEMSLGEAFGEQGRDVGNFLSSPVKNKVGKRSAYWETLIQVSPGDTVLHLRGKKLDNAAFVGFSHVSSKCEIINIANLSQEHIYKVELDDFNFFETTPSLKRFFDIRKEELKRYYLDNKNNPNKKLLFFTVKNSEIRRQEGAYFTELDEELAGIVGSYLVSQAPEDETIMHFAREGHYQFKKRVFDNYQSICCFPQCDIDDPKQLIASHVGRYADVIPPLRDSTENGLCLCRKHDKAFEDGYFTIAKNLSVYANPAINNNFQNKHIKPFNGMKIDSSKVPPSEEALNHHWSRIKLPASTITVLKK